MFSQTAGEGGLAVSGAGRELLQGAPPDCDPGLVERRYGVVGCRAEGPLLRSVMRTGPWMKASSGYQQVGALGVLLDHALGEIFYAARTPGQWSLTTELTLDVVVPPPWNTAALHMTSWVPQGGRGSGFAQGEVSDDSGTLVAVGTTRVQYVNGSGSPAAPQEAGARAGARCFADHLGVRIRSDEEVTRVELSDPERWNNPYGVLHGGVWASLVEVAAAETFRRLGDLRTAHVHVSYLRSATPGAGVRVEARKVHSGRSFGVVEAIGSDGAGRQCVTATITGRRYTS